MGHLSVMQWVLIALLVVVLVSNFVLGVRRWRQGQPIPVGRVLVMLASLALTACGYLLLGGPHDGWGLLMMACGFMLSLVLNRRGGVWGEKGG